MTFVRLLGGLAATTVLFSQPALALPDDAAALREIIATEFGGDANAYVEEEDGDFRRMACRNRADLVQQLLDDGLVASDIPFQTRERFYDCAFDEDGWDALALIIEPETLAILEREASTYALPLHYPVYGDDYKGTRLLLENGAHLMDTRSWTQGVLTEDGQRLLAARHITQENNGQAARGMEEAGYGEILADARQPGFTDLVVQIGTGSEAGGGGSGGLLGGIADIAIGAALGGSPADFLISGAGGSFIDAMMDGGSESATLSPEGVEMQRRLSRYLLIIEEPAEPEPPALAAQPSAAQAPVSATMSTLEELERLADLRDRGVLSVAEFEMMKDEILPQSSGTPAPAAEPATPPAETSRSSAGSSSAQPVSTEEETYASGQPVGDRNRFMFLATRRTMAQIAGSPNNGCSIPWDWGEWSSTPPADGWGTIACEEVDTVELFRVRNAADPCIYGGSGILVGPTTAARIFRIEPLTRAEVEVGVAYGDEEFHIFRRAQQDAKSTIEIRFVDRGPVQGDRFFRYRDAAERFIQQAGCSDIQYRTES